LRGNITVELLLEIGTEEIPAGYLENALNELKNLTLSHLKDNRIYCSEELLTYCTPRRLVLAVANIAEKQEDTVQEVTGPPKKAAYDPDGNPTKAALGFANKYGLSVDKLGCVETEKGEYLHARIEITGRPAKEVLAEILPNIISSIPWPKSMRWGDTGFLFARPIHWILAILDGNIIPFETAGIRSSNKTFGHRFMAPDEIAVKDLDDYIKKVRDASVMIKQDERKSVIETLVADMAKGIDGIPVEDPELIDINANLVEYPSATMGSFEKKFLELPDPVLITAMREHQKYFAVRDHNGSLINYFIAVNNTIANDDQVVRKGHERVLRARLSDATFFFEEDRKKSLEDRTEELKKLIYQAELGTSWAKVERFTALGRYLSEKLAPELKEKIIIASRLCKCDLVTEMVMEFPTLQGVMGSEYARLEGYPEDVCVAIREHYLPLRADDELPSSRIGAIVSLADRMDTIAGCFAIGREPTGAADPFALRRHALAIIRLMETGEYNLSLREFIATSLDILSDALDFKKDEVFNRIINFFRERYKNRMIKAGYETDLIEAVVSAQFDRINEMPARIEQLKQFTVESPDFHALALTFKRVSNILKNQDSYHTVDSKLFKDSSETKLWELYQQVKNRIFSLLDSGKYFEAMNLLVQLRQPVDNFFDSVEVLTKEYDNLRKNRVGVLQNIEHLFLNLVDFSKFSI
jgi:glycyl-tRNA synthetase beta chain